MRIGILKLGVGGWWSLSSLHLFLQLFSTFFLRIEIKQQSELQSVLQRIILLDGDQVGKIKAENIIS